MTMRGQKPNRLTAEIKAGQVDRHTFREKGLCSSANYHADLIEAIREYAALPHYTAALQVNDRNIRGEPSRFPGFFYEPFVENQLSGNKNSQQGGANAFMHHHRRFCQGWDSGKPDHEDDRG